MPERKSLSQGDLSPQLIEAWLGAPLRSMQIASLAELAPPRCPTLQATAAALFGRQVEERFETTDGKRSSDSNGYPSKGID